MLTFLQCSDRRLLFFKGFHYPRFNAMAAVLSWSMLSIQSTLHWFYSLFSFSVDFSGTILSIVRLLDISFVLCCFIKNIKSRRALRNCFFDAMNALESPWMLSKSRQGELSLRRWCHPWNVSRLFWRDLNILVVTYLYRKDLGIVHIILSVGIEFYIFFLFIFWVVF